MSKQPKNNGQRFAEKALVFVAVFLVLFTAAQYVSFLYTQIEQTTLIERVYTVVGLELGGLLLKRILEKIFGKKKPNDDSGSDDDLAG